VRVMPRSAAIWWIIAPLVFLIGCAPAAPTALSPTLHPQSATPILGISATPSRSLQPTSAQTPTIPSPTPVEAKTIPTTPTSAATNPTPHSTDQPTPSAVPVTPTVAVTATVAPTTTVAATDANACIDTAAYVDDVTIPDGTSFKPETPFVKTWKIKNAGACPWGPDYALVFHSGDVMDGPLSSPLPSIAPGEIGQISVQLKAPSSGGAFTGFWEFQAPSGRRFGVNSNGIDLIWAKIGVSIFDKNGDPAPVVGGDSPLTVPQGCTLQANTDYEQKLLDRINSARVKNGLPRLTLQKQLSAAAYQHSGDMGCNRFVDHTGSDGSTWFTRIKAQGYSYLYASENIYVGNPDFGGDPDGAFTWWMNSPVHRDNILSPKVTQIGIGYAYVTGSPYGGYYTLDFARK
jgi:uncharacterized protein YkwD